MVPAQERAADLAGVVGDPAISGVVVCSARVRIVVRRARPDGIFVELQSILPHTAEDHRPKAAVADGQGFDPLHGRFVIPERKWGERRIGHGAYEVSRCPRWQEALVDSGGRPSLGMAGRWMEELDE